MKILGIIPVRGGSKGIPNKNKKKLLGKPLLQYTVEAALGAKYLDRVIVSSEDADLISIAKSLGVDVPFVRPASLATDSSGSLEVVKHAITFLDSRNEHYDAICLLQVTTPFRTSLDIDLAVKKFLDGVNDTLLSVQKVPHHYNPHWTFLVSEKGTLNIATNDLEIIKRRQDLPDAFIRDGSIYITKTNTIIENNSLYGESIGYIETDSSRYVNIDTLEDWINAEQILKKELKLKSNKKV